MIDPNLLWTLTGAALLGSACGLLGTLAVLRGRALLGDALAHAALPGITTAFMVSGGQRDVLTLFAGALLGAGAGMLLIGWMTRRGVRADAALAISLSGLFALGLLQLSLIQHGGYGNASGLDRLLFGQAAAIMPADLIGLAILALVAVIGVMVLGRGLAAQAFDPTWARLAGLPVRRLELIAAMLLLTAVVLALHLVGVVLTAAMLMIPAATVRLRSRRMHGMWIGSTILGGAAALLGTWVSATEAAMPTGPWLVLSLGLVFFLAAGVRLLRGAPS